MGAPTDWPRPASAILEEIQDRGMYEPDSLAVTTLFEWHDSNTVEVILDQCRVLAPSVLEPLGETMLSCQSTRCVVSLIGALAMDRALGPERLER